MRKAAGTPAMILCTHAKYGSIENFTVHQKNPSIKKVYTLIPLVFFFAVLLVLFLMLKPQAPA